MALSIQEQLLRAFQERKARDGLTLDQLRRLSGLRCSEDSLGRKLAGKQALRSTEAEKLAAAMRVVVRAGKPPPASGAVESA